MTELPLKVKDKPVSAVLKLSAHLVNSAGSLLTVQGCQSLCAVSGDFSPVFGRRESVKSASMVKMIFTQRVFLLQSFRLGTVNN